MFTSKNKTNELNDTMTQLNIAYNDPGFLLTASFKNASIEIIGPEIVIDEIVIREQ